MYLVYQGCQCQLSYRSFFERFVLFFGSQIFQNLTNCPFVLFFNHNNLITLRSFLIRKNLSFLTCYEPRLKKINTYDT
jgi:hypothetical protein